MSLEAALKENTEVMRELHAVMMQDIELRRTAIEKVGEAVAKSSGGKTATTKTADKPAATAKPAATEGAADGASEAKAAIAEYMSGADNAKERSARGAKIKKLLSHAQIKAEGAPEVVTDLKDVDPKKYGAVVKNVKKYIEEGNLTEPDEDGEIDLG